MSSPLDAEQFADALHSERGLALPISAEGYVRKTADKAVIEFSPSAAMCLAWIKIPLKMIDKVQPLGKRPCIDHLHDYVILHFKRPESAEAVVFAELLHHEASARASSPAVSAEGMGAADRAVDCVVVRIFSFVGGGLIHSERVYQPDLPNKVRKILQSWGARPFGQNRPEISNC